MADEISVPPEALETLVKLKQLLELLTNQLQGVQVSADGSVTIRPQTVKATAHIPSASVSATARPETVHAKAHIPGPVVGVIAASLPALTGALTGHISEGAMEELPDEEAAQGVNLLLSTALGAREAISFFADLEGLAQLVERLHDLLS